MTTTLYRFYNRTGDLLYVGITDKGMTRWQQHRKDKPWWPEVARVNTEHFEARKLALEAERLAIRTERPLHNVAHNRVAGVVPPPVHRVLEWRCEFCRELIDDGTGYIYVCRTAIGQRRKAVELWESERPQPVSGLRITSVADLMQRPGPVRWVVTHEACDEHDDDGDYWFDVARARTIDDILDWTAHLLEKRWLPETDWSAFLRRVA